MSGRKAVPCAADPPGGGAARSAARAWRRLRARPLCPASFLRVEPGRRYALPGRSRCGAARSTRAPTGRRRAGRAFHVPNGYRSGLAAGWRAVSEWSQIRFGRPSPIYANTKLLPGKGPHAPGPPDRPGSTRYGAGDPRLSACRPARNRAAPGRCRAGAGGRFSGRDRKSSRSTAPPSRPCGLARTGR